METRTPSNPTASSGRGDLDAAASLAALRERGATYVRYFREATAIVGQGLDAARVRIESSAHGQEVTEDWHGADAADSWGELVRAVLLELAMDGETIARVVQDRSGPHLLIGIRLETAAGAPGAVMAVAMPCPSQERARELLAEARSLAELVGRNAPLPAAAVKPRVSADDVDAGIARSASYESPVQFAFKMVNSLRARLGAEQVCFGTVQRRRCRVTAISGQDDPRPRNPELRAVRQAMDETVDHGRALVAQDDDRWNDGKLSTGHRLHVQWREQCGGATVASFPLLDEDRVVAVVTVVRDRAKPFAREELEGIANLVAPYGASLRLLRRASRNIFVHAAQSLYGMISWAGSPAGLRWKAAGLLVAAGIAFAVFGTLPHVVTATAVVKAAESRHVGAPVEGRLDEIHVRPGDRITAGAVLLRFDTAELVLQRRELEAERTALDVEIERARGTGERAEARVLRARRDVVERRLEGIEARITLAEVRAPFDGLVIAGDLRDRRGDVFGLGEPLMELARGDGLQIEIRVDERDWRFLATKQEGEFAPNSHPEKGHAFHVRHVRDAAEVLEGRNAFVAEAGFDANASTRTLRPGMEGVARLEAGDRPVWWLASHRALDWLRLKTWL